MKKYSLVLLLFILMACKNNEIKKPVIILKTSEDKKIDVFSAYMVELEISKEKIREFQLKVDSDVEELGSDILLSANKRLDIENAIKLAKYYGNKFDVKPELILAIIHTESNFYHDVESNKNAIGLMQLIPKYGAKEGYEYIYGKQKEMTVDEVKDIELNVQYGVAYLKRLESHYLKSFNKSKEKQKYLVIASYNWGPTALRINFLNKYDIKKLSLEESYKILMKVVPNETKNYLKKVLRREKEYKEMLEELV